MIGLGRFSRYRQKVRIHQYKNIQVYSSPSPQSHGFFSTSIVRLPSWAETLIKRCTSFWPSNTRETPPTPRIRTRRCWAPNNLLFTREIPVYVGYSHREDHDHYIRLKARVGVSSTIVLIPVDGRLGVRSYLAGSGSSRVLEHPRMVSSIIYRSSKGRSCPSTLFFYGQLKTR